MKFISICLFCSVGFGAPQFTGGYVASLDDLFHILPSGLIDKTFHEGRGRYPLYRNLTLQGSDTEGRAILGGFEARLGYGMLAKLLPNGSLDKGFMNDGVHLFSDLSYLFHRFIELPGGAFIACRSVGENGTPFSFLCQKLNSDGTWNKEFGEGGKIQAFLPAEPVLDLNTGVLAALDSKGRILVTHEGCIRWTYCIRQTYRYDEGGHLDTSFGTHGVIEEKEESSGTTLWINQIVESADGGFFSQGAKTEGGGFVRKMLPSGKMDEAFGGGGYIYLTPEDPTERLRVLSIKKDDDENLFVLTMIENERIAVWRIVNGRVDNSFGEVGKVTFDVFGSISRVTTPTLFFDSNGFYVAFGDEIYDPAKRKMKLGICNQKWRYNGTVDESFADKGRQCFLYQEVI